MRSIYLDKAFPDAYRALIEVSKQAGLAAQAAGLQPLLVELVKIRASQLNGCAYCLRLHTRDALAKGETTDRLAVLSAWRDTDYFTEAERAALAITEEITLIADVTSGRRAADEVHPELTEAQVAAVRWLGIAINAFNRVSITSHHPVDPDTEPAPAKAAPFVVEFPDEAGYPDGAGTLDEGTKDAAPSDAIVADLAEFDEPDNRDS
jgi:AhpD family alkylhydroperoxidase